MVHGDFTELAKYYGNRPGYSITLLECLKCYISDKKKEIIVADVGAGTGKLTENLSFIGTRGYAVEPNDAMRNEGIKLFNNNSSFKWSKGTAEMTELPDSSVDWVLMGSSFHWADSQSALKEFYRILKPGGYFTAIWNPRNIESSELHMEIENIVYSEVQGMKRVSSGSGITLEDMTKKLLDASYFSDILFMEALHEEIMSKERYLNTWRSVNDIQVQAGEEKFGLILEKIEKVIENMDEIAVPYKSRAWTVRSNKR